METYDAQQDASVPHMENPFELKEEKTMDSSSSPFPSSGDDGSSRKQSKKKSQKRNSNAKAEIASSSSTGVGVEEKDDEEKKNNSPTGEDDDNEGEGELNYMSMTDAIGSTFIEPGQDASAESSFDSEHKEDDDKQTDTSEEERGRRESAKRIVRQLAVGEERLAGVQMDDNTRRMLDEDAVQDALIQAAEDAMRYAYEEAARKQQTSSSSTNSLPNSFEQHQLAEVLVRQKQGLLRLEELEHKLDEMGNQMDKMASLIQQKQQTTPSALPSASVANGPSTEPSEGSTSSSTTASMNESASMPTEVPNLDTASNISGPPSIRTARRLIDDATIEQQQGTSLNNKQDYPLSVTLPRRVMLYTLQLIDLIKSQSSQLMQQLSTKLLARLGKESWNDVRLTMRSTLREVGTRIIVQLRRLRMLISEGRLDPSAGQSQGWRQIYEGFEDRVLATTVISALVTLFLLYRHRQRQNLMQSARETASLAPSTLLANHVQQAGPLQQKRSAAPVPFLVT